MITETELATFFDKAFEGFINEKLFFRSYQLDRQKMAEYTDGIISIPIQTYVEYLATHVIPPRPFPNDVYQFSSLEDATTNLCAKLTQSGDEGVRYVEIGRLLLDDGKIRKSGALTKYGENHAKTAVDLGLAQNKSDYIFLSCLGIVFNDYNKYKKCELIKRLALRNRFIQSIVIKSQRGPVFLEEEMEFLSESTIKRRLSNIRSMFALFNNDEMTGFRNIKGLNFIPEQLDIVPLVADAEEQDGVTEYELQKLWSTFSHTTTSYNYYWFLSILSLIERHRASGCSRVPALSVREIMSGMVSEALSDSFSIKCTDPLILLIQNIINQNSIIDSYGGSNTFDLIYNELYFDLQSKLSQIWDVVSCRFLSPWIPFSTNNGVAQKSREMKNVPYCFVPDSHNESILIAPIWEDYLYKNKATLRDKCRVLLNDYFSLIINNRVEDNPVLINRSGVSVGSSTRSGRSKIRVVFPDGKELCLPKVADTLVDLVNFAGPENVAALNITCDDINLVSKTLHPKYSKAQKQANDGWLVLTHSCTATKFRQMKSISDGLSLNLLIELVSD